MTVYQNILISIHNVSIYIYIINDISHLWIERFFQDVQGRRLTRTWLLAGVKDGLWFGFGRRSATLLTRAWQDIFHLVHVWLSNPIPRTSNMAKRCKKCNCHLGISGVGLYHPIYGDFGLLFFCGLPHYWQKIWGPMKRSKALHPCFVHALYFDRILHLHWGEWIQRKMEILKIGYSKTFPVGPREIGIWTPWSMKDPATFPRKVVFLRTFTDIKMGCPNGPGAFNSMVIWKQALDFSLSKYLQVFPMNILVGSLESWHEHTHTINGS